MLILFIKLFPALQILARSCLWNIEIVTDNHENLVLTISFASSDSRFICYLNLC